MDNQTDLKVGNTIDIVFTEDFTAEIVYQYHFGGEYSVEKDFKKDDHIVAVVAGVDIYLESVTLLYEDGTIYSVPREFFSVILI